MKMKVKKYSKFLSVLALLFCVAVSIVGPVAFGEAKTVYGMEETAPATGEAEGELTEQEQEGPTTGIASVPPQHLFIFFICLVFSIAVCVCVALFADPKDRARIREKKAKERLAQEQAREERRRKLAEQAAKEEASKEE